MIIAMPIKTSSPDTALAPLFGNAKFFAFATDTAQIYIVQMEQLGETYVHAYGHTCCSHHAHS